jgi:penicillin-binding protein 2
MAVYAATLANGGTRVTPHVVKAIDDGSGWKPVPTPLPQSKIDIDPEKLQAIRDGLWMVVNGAGTGHNAQIKGYDVSGKTGTAQAISLEGGRAAKGKTTKNLNDHGWFVFFAPRDHPQIAGVIFAEHGQHGSNAAIVARHAMDVFFAKKEGRPLPTLTPKGSTPAEPDVTEPPPQASPVEVADTQSGSVRSVRLQPDALQR